MRFDRVTHLPNGNWQLELVEVPDWALGLRWLFDELDGRLDHVLCGEGLPDRWYYYHLAGWLHDLATKILFLPDTAERVLHRSEEIPPEGGLAAVVLASFGPEY